MKRCLVTGATGFLGREAAARLSADFQVVGLGYRQGGPGLLQVDLREPDALRAVLRQVKPDVVVHAAAYRGPDLCEDDPREAWRLNVDPVRVLCEALAPSCRLLLMSSDYVFDGEDPPYREDSTRRPVNRYGQSKVEAEDLVMARPGSLIIRAPVLVGAGPSLASSGFIGEMVSAVRSLAPVVLDDVLVRFPTWTRDVAEAMRFLLRKGAEGVFHVSGPRGGTRYALTVEVASILGEPSGHLRPSSAVVPRKAPRPRNAQLATAKIRALGYTHLTDFPVVVGHVLRGFEIMPG